MQSDPSALTLRDNTTLNKLSALTSDEKDDIRDSRGDVKHTKLYERGREKYTRQLLREPSEPQREVSKRGSMMQDLLSGLTLAFSPAPFPAFPCV